MAADRTEEADDAEESDFDIALLQLQAIHQSKVRTLQEKLDHQLTINTAQENDLRELRQTVLRLQQVVAKASRKVKHQAAVISEQAILIHRIQQGLSGGGGGGQHHGNLNGTSAPYHTCATLFDSPSLEAHIGTSHGNGATTGGTNLKDNSVGSNDETVLPAPLTLRTLSMETVGVGGEELEDVSPSDLASPKNASPNSRTTSPSVSPKLLSPKELQHVPYSHACVAVETVAETPKPTTKTTKTSLTCRGRKVQYKSLSKPVATTLPPQQQEASESLDSNLDSPSLLMSEPLSGSSKPSSLPLQPEDGVRAEDSPTSPSLLQSDSLSSQRSSESDQQAPPPMTCSMFTAAPYSMHVPDDGERSAGDGSPTASEDSDHSSTNCLPRTPLQTPVKQKPTAGKSINQIASKLRAMVSPPPSSDGSDTAAASVIPSTPGIRSVKSLTRSTAQPPPPQPKCLAAENTTGNGAQVERLQNDTKKPSDAVMSSDPGADLPSNKAKGISTQDRPSSHQNSTVGTGGGNNSKPSLTKKLAAASGGNALKHRYQKRSYNPQSVAGGGASPRKRAHHEPHPISAAKRPALGPHQQQQQEEEEEEVIVVRTEGQPSNQNVFTNRDALKVAEKYGLPTDYKYDAKILKTADRDKLDAKPCPDCKKWYESGGGGVHGNQRAHLRHTCRHKHIHLPPDSDPRLWDISFNTEEEHVEQ